VLTRLEEQRIISSILSGNYNAFETLVLENQKIVYNLALKLTGNEHDALDISQDAFIKAYENLINFRGDSKFSVWIYKLTYNMCIDFLRKKQKRNITSLTQTDDDSTLSESDIQDISNLPEDIVERKELMAAVNSAINSLSHEHREILIMRSYSDMSYKDIAETLYISEGTVKSRIARARQALLKILVSNGTFDEYIRLTKGKEDKLNG